MIQVKQFDNGLKLVVNKMTGLMSVTMGILVRTGSAVETDEEDGISHFIEHMLFKGTKKRTSFQISDDMDRIGAQMNAFTSKELTSYYAKSTTGHAEEAFEILADLFLNNTFPEDEMAREKGVILEEISMNEDTPDDLCLDLLSSAYFGNNGYGRNILGPRKNVSGFTVADARKYMGEHYTADNIVISMAGNIDEDLAVKLVEKYFSSLPKAEGKSLDIKVELKSNNIVKRKDIEQVHLAVAYPSVTRKDKLFDATQIMNAILGGSMSSRLFQTVREELGLAYTVYSYISTYTRAGALCVYAGVNAEKYEQSLDAIYKCIENIKKKDISEEEFVRGKEQLIASQIFAQENTSSQMLLFGKALLYDNEHYDFEKRINTISSVTLDDVMQAIEYNFDDKVKATALVGAVDKNAK